MHYNERDSYYRAITLLASYRGSGKEHALNNHHLILLAKLEKRMITNGTVVVPTFYFLLLVVCRIVFKVYVMMWMIRTFASFYLLSFVVLNLLPASTQKRKTVSLFFFLCVLFF